MIYVSRVGDHLFPVPRKAHKTDAGYDLVSVADIAIKPGALVLVPTGFHWAISSGYVGLIWPRSGMSVKRRLTTDAGVIDAGFRGEVMVALKNESSDVQLIEAGERIAQMLVMPVATGTLVEVKDLPDTSRGDNGFGSTGR